MVASLSGKDSRVERFLDRPIVRLLGFVAGVIAISVFLHRQFRDDPAATPECVALHMNKFYENNRKALDIIEPIIKEMKIETCGAPDFEDNERRGRPSVDFFSESHAIVSASKELSEKIAKAFPDDSNISKIMPRREHFAWSPMGWYYWWTDRYKIGVHITH